MIISALAVLSAIGGLVALLFRANAKQHKAEAKSATERAEQSEAVSDTQQRAQSERENVQKKHRKEQRDAQAKLDAGDRDHLDNDW